MEARNILKLIKNSIAPLIVIIIAAGMRLLPHPPNIVPIGGLALFSGAHIGGLTAFIFPLFAMLISDIVLGFHSTMIYVYFSFAIIVLVGRWCGSKKLSAKRLLSVSFTSSVLFYLITNFGAWVSMGIYEKSVFGLVKAYLYGLPFFRNTIIGDIIYSFSFFYGLKFIQGYIKKANFQFLIDHFK